MANRYGDEDEPRKQSRAYEQEPYRPPMVPFGQESFSDEWMSFERSRDFERSRARGPGRGPKGYTRSDTRIHEEVCESLMYSPYDASDVTVTVSNGEVTLAGTVRSRADKWGIEDVAEAVLGVRDVHNQIRINRDAAHDSEPILGGDTGHYHS